MNRGLTEQIVEAIAEAEGKQPDELTIALEDYVDTDAIRALAKHDSTSWALEFDLPTHTVQVTGQEVVLVDDAQQQILVSES